MSHESSENLDTSTVRISYEQASSNMGDSNLDSIREEITKIREEGVNIQWTPFCEHTEGSSSRFNNYGSFAFSHIDKTDKFSEGYGPCLGVLVSAKCVDTEEVISFLSHQTLHAMSGKKFIEVMNEALQQMDSLSGGSEIRFRVFGGRQNMFNDSLSQKFEEVAYKKSVDILTALAQAHGSKIEIVSGPKTDTEHPSAIYYDNKIDRLILVQSK